MNRIVTLILNDTITRVDVATDETGRFSYVLPVQYPTEGHYYYTAEFRKADGSFVRTSWDFPITLGLPPGLDTALLITWIIVIGIEAVVAMLIVARYRYSGRGFGFSRFRLSRSSSEIHDSLVR